MCILRKEGRLEEFSTRCKRGETELESWNTQRIGSEDNVTNLKRIIPDIVQKLNQKKIQEMELKRMKMEREMEAANNDEGEHLIFNAEYVCEGQPPDKAEPDYRPLIKQQLNAIRQQEEMRLEEMIKEQKSEARKQRKQKNQERKAALNVPLGPFPEKELCQYEKITENNIKEREKSYGRFWIF